MLNENKPHIKKKNSANWIRQYGFGNLGMSEKTENTKMSANWCSAERTRQIGGRQFGVRQSGMNSLYNVILTILAPPRAPHIYYKIESLQLCYTKN